MVRKLSPEALIRVAAALRAIQRRQSATQDPAPEVTATSARRQVTSGRNPKDAAA